MSEDKDCRQRFPDAIQQPDVHDVTEAKEAEAALRESEARYRSLFEQSLDGALLTIPDGTILAANPAICAMLGRTEEEIRRIGRAGVIDMSDPRVAAALEERARTGRCRADLRMVRSDGTKFEAEITSSIFLDRHDGERTAMFIRDLTERKNSEEALRDSETRFRTLYESMQQGAFYQLADGKLLDVNPAALEMLGLPKEEFCAGDPYRPTWRVIREDGSTIPPEEYPTALALRTGQPVEDFVVGVLNPNAEGCVWMVINAIPEFREGDQEPHRVAVTMHDMTERKRGENALADSEKRYRRLVESSPDGIAVESGGKIVYANQAATRILGASRTERLLGMPYLDLVDPEYRKAAAHIIEEGSPLERVPSIETRLRSLQGRPIDVEAAFIPMSSDGVPEVHIVFRDISERKQLEQIKSDFVATVSHELRSPLAVILGFATFLEQNAGDASRRDETCRAAHTIHERGTFMKSLVESLLEMSRIQSGEFALSLDSVDLGGLLTIAAREVALGKRQELALKVSSHIGPVVCDPQRLSVAVSNLVANAVKFSPDGGVVQVSAKRKGGRVLISVSDEGIGISRTDQAHIFDRFTQADMSSTRRFAGVGMGLYITRQVVEAHGGTLSVRSRLGEGSTFMIDIPLAQTRTATGSGSGTAVAQ